MAQFLKPNVIRPGHLTANFRKKRFFYEKFSSIASILQYGTQTTPVSVPTLPTAAQDNIARIITSNGNVLDLYSTTAQTLLPIPHATKGWDISCDKVNNECIEIVPGGNHALSPLAMVAGTDSNFYFSATMELTDVSGTDQFLIGWRKQEAFIVPVSFLTTGDALYTDFCALGFCTTSANPQVVKQASDLNNGGSTTVSSSAFTWADTLKHKVECWVVKRVAKWFINGVPLGASISKDADGGAITAQATVVPTAFTFDTGDTLIPFLFLRHDATSPDANYLSEMEVGFLEDKFSDPTSRNL